MNAQTTIQTDIQTSGHIETANIVFQAVTIVLVGLYTLAETVRFLSSAIA